MSQQCLLVLDTCSFFFPLLSTAMVTFLVSSFSSISHFSTLSHSLLSHVLGLRLVPFCACNWAGLGPTDSASWLSEAALHVWRAN